MCAVEKGSIKMERKRIIEEAATRLVRRGKAHPESVEEVGRRVNAI